MGKDSQTTIYLSRVIEILTWILWGMVISAGITATIIKTSHQEKATPIITYKDCREFIEEAERSHRWPYTEIVPDKKLSNPGYITAVAFKLWVSYIDWEAYRPKRLGPRDPTTQNYLISPTGRRWLTK